jgi:1,4-alpha-glucan branching enzyme
MIAALFEGKLRGKPSRSVSLQGGGESWWVTDPYSFGPVLGPLDDF